MPRETAAQVRPPYKGEVRGIDKDKPFGSFTLQSVLDRGSTKIVQPLSEGGYPFEPGTPITVTETTILAGETGIINLVAAPFLNDILTGGLTYSSFPESRETSFPSIDIARAEIEKRLLAKMGRVSEVDIRGYTDIGYGTTTFSGFDSDRQVPLMRTVGVYGMEALPDGGPEQYKWEAFFVRSDEEPNDNTETIAEREQRYANRVQRTELRRQVEQNGGDNLIQLDSVYIWDPALKRAVAYEVYIAKFDEDEQPDISAMEGKSKLAGILNKFDRAFEGEAQILRGDGRAVDLGVLQYPEATFNLYLADGQTLNPQALDELRTLLLADQLKEASSARTEDFVIDYTDEADPGEKDEFRTDGTVYEKGEVEIVASTTLGDGTTRTLYYGRNQGDDADYYTLRVSQLSRERDNFYLEYGMRQDREGERTFYARLNNGVVGTIDGKGNVRTSNADERNSELEAAVDAFFNAAGL